jgi:hypothetical protein
VTGDEHALDEQAIDMTAVARDALLLDVLARNDPPPDGDDVAALLSAWRADLAGDPAAASVAPSGAPSRRHTWRPGRVLLAAAAAVLALAGAVTLAAGHAGPGSPLWPITTLVYEDRAGSRLAQQQVEATIARADEAIHDSRYGEAGRLLDEATALVGQVNDEAVARRLTDQIAVLRNLLPGGATVPAPLPTTAPPIPQPSSGGPASGQPGGATPQPTGGLPPPSPGLPLPSLPLPSLPAIVPPALPLPTLPILPSIPQLPVIG